ncbi:AsmA family protein [Aminobacter anthyllidis]|uniref:AsmA family protein n=1 Tax=Aminobacter anthyllidis TaxID=1035067 RepID=A0A9X1AAC8_9HYPH|nr:AsmA family protein [Aminobacter anthyllidis]MBT1156205.1 AsmA family protein [Aminobacter anthyllidis]
MLARLFVIFGGLFVLALCAGLVGPYFIDWSGYKAEFEREASAILGRKVVVQGEVTARILPFPSVTFSDVIVGGGTGGNNAMTVETFSMDAELAPLLSGEFLIYDMRLVRPKAIIDLAADGVVDWAIRPSAPFDAKQISIEKLTITEGQVRLRHAASGREHLLSEINTSVSARALSGPWRVDGSLRIDGMKTQLSASTGSVDPTGQMRLRVRAAPERYGFVVESDGNASMDKGRALYSGGFSVVEAQPEPAAAADGEKPKPPAKPVEPGFRLKGKFALDHAKLGVEEFRFESGPLDDPYTADGTAEVDLGTEPHFAITANGAQVRFDEAVGGEKAGGPGFSIPQRLTALEKVLVELPRPSIPGTVEVDLPAVVAGDTTVRDVKLSAEPGEGGWKLKSMAATLPGRTRLEADGFLRTEDNLGFDGQMLLAVGQPSGFAAWVAKDVDEAVRKLPAAGFKAKVRLTREQQTFDGIELILGKARFTGELDSMLPDDSRASVMMKLDGGELDLDGLRAFASLFVTDQGANRFSDADLDLAVKAGPLNFAGLSADTVDTALRLREGVLEIDKLSVGGLAGASLSATGRIKDFPEAPTGNLDASVVAVDLAPLVALAAKQAPDNKLLNGLAARAAAYPGLLADARIDFVASAVDNGDKTTGIALSGQGEAGGSDLLATLSAQAIPGALASSQLKLEFSARNEDATSLLALAGLPVLPLGVTGPGELALSAKGAVQNGLEVVASLKGDDASAGFAGTVALRDGIPSLKGRATLQAADLEPWLMTSTVTLPGMGTGMQVELATDASLGGGVLALDRLDGTVNEGAVVGHLKAELNKGLPHLSGSLTLDELDLRPFAEMTLGATALESGDGAWPTAAFAPKPVAPFSADLEIVAGTLLAEPLATANDAVLALQIDSQALRLSNIKAKLFGGDLGGLVELKNNDGTAFISGQLKLDGIDVAAMPWAGEASGKGNFSATLSGSGKSVEGLVASLSGSGTADVAGLSLPGFNPDAFAPLIAKADALGRDINAARVAEFAPGIAGEGSFVADKADVAFTIAGGILRAPPLTLKNPAATLSADLRADLNAGVVAASGSITYAPGKEQLVGSEPMMNFELEGEPGATVQLFDSAPMAQFLTQRALEKEQARVEAMQAVLLEKQRLRRETRYFVALKAERERIAEEARLAEEARIRAEEEAKAKAEAERLKAELEAKAKAEAERLRAEEERRGAEAAEKAKAEADREKARLQAEKARRATEEKVRLEAERKAKLEAEAAKPAAEVERAPLPEVRPMDAPVEAVPASPAPPPAAAPVKKKLEPLSLDDFFKSLQSQ